MREKIGWWLVMLPVVMCMVGCVGDAELEAALKEAGENRGEL